MAEIAASVVIPTFNRATALVRTLEGVLAQDGLPGPLEVIVVDDGSADETARVLRGLGDAGACTYVRQPNQGAAAARNTGAAHSSGDVLVFLDDDIYLQPGALAALVRTVTEEYYAVALGALVTPEELRTTPFARAAVSEARARESPLFEVHYTHCMTGLLALRRSNFVAVGGFEDPTGGWPNWDDVAFGRAAHCAGFRIVRTAEAVGEHWDYALVDLATSCRRWERASEAAATLFRHYPDLVPVIPMFHDKRPVNWSEDSPGLVMRKLARQAISARPVREVMEAAARLLDTAGAPDALRKPLYRWIAGGYMYAGVRRGSARQEGAWQS
jgi:glycosyltransferase involved in cell wall biosynthesis